MEMLVSLEKASIMGAQEPLASNINIYTRNTVSAAVIVLGSSGASVIKANPKQSNSGSITRNTGGMRSTQASVVYHAFM